MVGKKRTANGKRYTVSQGVLLFLLRLIEKIMEGKVCCFIGHRNVKKTTELKEKLTKTLHWLITEKEVDKFLFGSKSNFDDFCQEIVKGLKEEYPHIKRVYVRMYYPELGEQYMEYILRDFEDTYMPERIENAGI